MQFYKKTSIGSSVNPLKIVIKIVLVITALSVLLILVAKINFPSPNQEMQKIIPKENLKIVK